MIEKEKLEKLINKGLSQREIGIELGKSQCSIKYWLRMFGLKTRPKRLEKNTNCILCGNILCGSQILFCSKKCKAKFHYYESYKIKQTKRGHDRKLKLVIENGGACKICGYNKNLAALTFHHLEKKEFNLDIKNIANISLEKINNEVKKCILLCANCHLETHYPNLKINTISN